MDQLPRRIELQISNFDVKINYLQIEIFYKLDRIKTSRLTLINIIK